MSTRTKPTRAIRLVVAATAAIVASQLGVARITVNTIDPISIVTESGRHIVVSGPIECAAGERAHLSVTLSQRTTGAVATASTFVVCTGERRQWDIDAVVIGNERFEPGPAIAVAVAQTTSRGVATDAHQWLVPVTLVEE